MTRCRLLKTPPETPKSSLDLVYKDEFELGDEVRVTVIATGFDAEAPDTFGAQGREYAPRYDDAGAYQRQSAPAHEERPSGPSRTRSSTGRTVPQPICFPSSWTETKRRTTCTCGARRTADPDAATQTDTWKGSDTAAWWYRLGNPGISPRFKKRAEQQIEIISVLSSYQRRFFYSSLGLVIKAT